MGANGKEEVLMDPQPALPGTPCLRKHTYSLPTGSGPNSGSLLTVIPWNVPQSRGFPLCHPMQRKYHILHVMLSGISSFLPHIQGFSLSGPPSILSTPANDVQTWSWDMAAWRQPTPRMQRSVSSREAWLVLMTGRLRMEWRHCPVPLCSRDLCGMSDSHPFHRGAFRDCCVSPSPPTTPKHVCSTSGPGSNV